MESSLFNMQPQNSYNIQGKPEELGTYQQHISFYHVEGLSFSAKNLPFLPLKYMT